MAVTMLAYVAAALVAAVGAQPMADRVTNLPGLPYNAPFDMWSGYLDGGVVNGTQTYLFYWATGYQGKDSPDVPVIFWYNGGPGCSSLGGLLEELGPFHTNERGYTLWENVFSWNKVGHVVYVESPPGVGFSYSDKGIMSGRYHWNDDMTAEINANGIDSLFKKFEPWQSRKFFISGESYGGVYIPTMSTTIIDRMRTGNFSNMNFAGTAIGNGYLDQKRLFNGDMNFFYGHGLVGDGDFNMAKEACCGSADANADDCDFYSVFYSDPNGKCAEWSSRVYNGVMGMLPDPYNIYQSCYHQRNLNAMYSGPLKHILALKELTRHELMEKNGYGEQMHWMHRSTNHLDGFACYADDSNYKYLNLAEVQDALHVNMTWRESVGEWNDCTNGNFAYDNQYTYLGDHVMKMLTPFDDSTGARHQLRVMMYNGDVDTVCNFLGDQWFAHNVSATMNLTNTVERKTWFYRNQVAGRYESFENFDVVTVSGAGHFVPEDRAGPAMQMLYNFVMNTMNYSGDTGINTDYQPYNKLNMANIVKDLPGVPNEPVFDQYSGYLDGGMHNGSKIHLFHWFVEYAHPDHDDVPVILWLNGGPGCSSLGGFFTENGPFHPNADGQTLFNDMYAWNDVGHVLYLESPGGVGFSFADDGNLLWDDDLTSMMNAHALNDFFESKYPQLNGRRWFITGESYGGIYIPTLSQRVVQMISAGTFANPNFMGFAIGNGCMGGDVNLNSMLNLFYYYGVIGEYEWLDMKTACCGNADASGRDCDFNMASSNSTSMCYKTIDAVFENIDVDDPYNLYQSCYAKSNIQARRSNVFDEEDAAQQLISQLWRATQPNDGSTDANGGFSCYGGEANAMYLNTKEVQKAVHVSPAFSGKWSDCNMYVNRHYTRMYASMEPQFNYLLQPFQVNGTGDWRKLHVLIYNGDTDTVCNHLGDEWFMHRVARNNSLQMTMPRRPWKYGEQLAGLEQQYDGRLTIATVNGAGHFVPMDRPGPALKMIRKFIDASSETTTTTTSSTTTTTVASTTDGAGALSSGPAALVALLCALVVRQ